MKKTICYFITLIFSCLMFSILCPLGHAAIPHLINYQGRLTDKDNKPLEGSYALTFRIYDAETAGHLLWGETHSNALIQKGIFAVLLGSVTNLDLGFDRPYFLEIKVGDEVMSPRQQITSSAYAIRAEKAEQANNADTVSNVGVNITPTPNKILPLDSSGKFPATTLKFYDSGWFAVSANNSYTKTHGLGTTKILLSVYIADNSDGSGDCVQVAASCNYDGNQNGVNTYSLTNNTISVRANDNYLYRAENASGTIVKSSGYCRIIILALE